MSPSKTNLLIALYSAHYNAKEASALTGIPYQKVAEIYRTLKLTKQKKHSRKTLLSKQARYFLDSLGTTQIA